MDLMKPEKLKANRKRDDLIQNILVHSLTSLTCVLLCSYGFWLPSLISSAESFLFVSLPHWKPFLVNAKTLFLVSNLIVVFLVVDSELRRAAKRSLSSPVADLYDEYVEWSKRLRGMHINGIDEKEERGREVQPEPAEDEGEQKSGGGVEFKGSLAEEPTKSTEEDLRDAGSDEGGESNELPARSVAEDQWDPESNEGGESDELPKKELTRRVEEFIARVNKKRWLESRSLIIPPI